MPEMIFSFLSLPYFKVIRIVLKLPSSTTSYFLMKPSFTRMSAIANFILEDGTSTVSCFAVLALRILVSISAIGSLIVMIIFPPNGLLVYHCGSRIIRAAQECCSAWGKQVFRIGVVTMNREVLFPVVEERDQSAYQALLCTARRGNTMFPPDF